MFKLKIIILLNIALFIFLIAVPVWAQKSDRVEVFWKFPAESKVECQESEPGLGVIVPKPNYPSEAKAARIGGTIFVTVKIDEKGDVVTTENVAGHRFLRKAATSAAQTTKFAPPLCNGQAAASKAFLTYHFVPYFSVKGYSRPAKIEGFTDIGKDSPFYGAIAELMENYRLVFGYGNKNFYPDAPLTRGDFAQTLRATLDMLAERAKTVNKNPREINLYYPYNPQQTLAASDIKNLKSNEPFYDAVKTLMTKYDVVLTDEKKSFTGGLYLTNDETIEWWTKIFGAEAIPVNFRKSGGEDGTGDPIISRGEFALFLQESLQVLTYKVSP